MEKEKGFCKRKRLTKSGCCDIIDKRLEGARSFFYAKKMDRHPPEQIPAGKYMSPERLTSFRICRVTDNACFLWTGMPARGTDRGNPAVSVCSRKL